MCFLSLRALGREWNVVQIGSDIEDGALEFGFVEGPTYEKALWAACAFRRLAGID
jgi:hypothetical protein